MDTARQTRSAPNSGSLGAKLMRSTTEVRAGRVGGIYDIVVTVGFATPWTAALILDLLARLHETTGLPGDAMPTFATSHVLFVALFGVVVTMWGVVRSLRATPFLVSVDTVGRAVFASWFTWALLAGHSTVLVGFLVLELAFLVAQAMASGRRCVWTPQPRRVTITRRRPRTMQALVRDRYGSPDVLELLEVPMPDVTDDGVLVRVAAASLNAADLEILRSQCLPGMRTGLVWPPLQAWCDRKTASPRVSLLIRGARHSEPAST